MSLKGQKTKMAILNTRIKISSRKVSKSDLIKKNEIILRVFLDMLFQTPQDFMKIHAHTYQNINLFLQRITYNYYKVSLTFSKRRSMKTTQTQKCTVFFFCLLLFLLFRTYFLLKSEFPLNLLFLSDFICYIEGFLPCGIFFILSFCFVQKKGFLFKTLSFNLIQGFYFILLLCKSLLIREVEEQ